VSERLTHIGWDRGLLADVVDPLLAVELGIYPPPAKTTTARCGKAGRRAAGGPGPVRGAHPTSRDRDLDRALLGCGVAHLAGHCRCPIVLQPGCRCGTRPATPPTTDAATTAPTQQPKKEGCRPATTPSPPSHSRRESPR
jgi:hypothetical protein